MVCGLTFIRDALRFWGGVFLPRCVCLSLCLWALTAPVRAQSAFVTPLGDTSMVLRVLQATQGDVLLALIDARAETQQFWPRLLGRSGQLSLTLNAEPLGTYPPDALLRVTPRTGVNRLEVRAVDAPARPVTFLFSMLRSAGVPNQLLVVENNGVDVTVEAISASDSARIKRVLSGRNSVPLADTLAVIEARGRLAIPATTSTPNWSTGRVTADSSNDSDSDGPASGSSPVSGEDRESSAQSTTSDTTVDSPTESLSDPAETDVAADRRSYL